MVTCNPYGRNDPQNIVRQVSGNMSESFCFTDVFHENLFECFAGFCFCYQCESLRNSFFACAMYRRGAFGLFCLKEATVGWICRGLAWLVRVWNCHR